jgi:toxin FitB
MSGVLLDTNVLSELTRLAPSPEVVTYLQSLDTSYVSVISLHELQFGLARLPDGRRRRDLASVVERMVALYEDAILPIDKAEATRAGELQAELAAAGRTLHLADALIAATALVHDLTLATRNIDDFAGLGLNVADPWGA